MRAGIPASVPATATYKAAPLTIAGLVFGNAHAATQTAAIHDATGATNLVGTVSVPPGGSVVIDVPMRFTTGLHLVLSDVALTAMVIEA